MAEQVTTAEADDVKRVNTFELFFDLVFVFAFIQVTAMVISQPDLVGLGRGLIVLALLWWAWAGFAWLTNAVDTSADSARVVLLAAMAAILMVAVAVPTAFTDSALFFAGAYLVVRALHLVLYAVTARHAILRLAPGFAVACALLLSGALVSGWLQVALWSAAIAIDYGYPLVRGVRGLTVHAAHWAERYELVVILALGETVIATGLGVVSTEQLTLRGATGIAVAIGVIGALWWAYFTREADRTHEILQRAQGNVRTYLARDLYAYLHAALVCGIIISAAGLENALHHPLDPLADIYPVALGGGAAAFLLSLAAIRWRRGDRPRPEHLVGVVVCAGLIGPAYAIPAVASLAALGAVLAAVTVVDRGRHRRSAGPRAAG